MDKKSDILTKVGKDAGFNVPEGYFADFAKKMAASLPEKQIPAKRKPTRWLRIRPYVYMAAMFAGANSIGVCGATSTPKWLMEEISEAIKSKLK